MSQLSLLDIGTLTKEVPFRNTYITVYGLNADAIFMLMSKFSGVKNLVEQTSNTSDLNPKSFANLGAEAMQEIIAACTLNREEYSTLKAWRNALSADAKRAQKLPFDTQMAILEAAIELTFPEGTGPFVARILSMMEKLGIKDLINKIQAADLLPKDSDMTSQQLSSAALQTGTTKRVSGALHLDS
jgi:hypothetical protein